MTELVRIERGVVSTITINRPEKLNALDRSMLGAIADAWTSVISGEPRTRAVVLTGEGKAFVAGADISEMQSMRPAEARAFAKLGQQVFAAFEASPVPVIAAVNGFALGGGCELALACDFVFASEKAKFGQPEVKLGVIPGFGGTQRLLRRVGVGHARELIYTGATIDAAEALRIGLVNRVFPHDELLSQARKVAEQIASAGPVAVRLAKDVMREGEMKDLAVATSLEADRFADCFETTDQKEGMEAFLAKRSATFAGR